MGGACASCVCENEPQPLDLQLRRKALFRQAVEHLCGRTRTARAQRKKDGVVVRPVEHANRHHSPRPPPLPSPKCAQGHVCDACTSHCGFPMTGLDMSNGPMTPYCTIDTQSHAVSGGTVIREAATRACLYSGRKEWQGGRCGRAIRDLEEGTGVELARFHHDRVQDYTIPERSVARECVLGLLRARGCVFVCAARCAVCVRVSGEGG